MKHAAEEPPDNTFPRPASRSPQPRLCTGRLTWCIISLDHNCEKKCKCSLSFLSKQRRNSDENDVFNVCNRVGVDQSGRYSHSECCALAKLGVCILRQTLY
jgi:hypothetical protein